MAANAIDVITASMKERTRLARQLEAAILALAECIAADSAEPAREHLAGTTILGQPGDQLDARHLALLRRIVNDDGTPTTWTTGTWEGERWTGKK